MRVYVSLCLPFLFRISFPKMFQDSHKKLSVLAPTLSHRIFVPRSSIVWPKCYSENAPCMKIMSLSRFHKIFANRQY